MGSDRGFGLVFAAVFSIVAGFQGWSGGIAAAWGWLAVALTFAAAALVAPKILNPLNRLWFRFGMLLHRIVTPVILGLMFYGTVVPTGLALRLFGKDLLHLKAEPEAESYWIKREPSEITPESLRNQF